MRNGPAVTVWRGATATSRSPTSMPCSSSFGSTSASVKRRAVDGPVDAVDHVGDRADVIFVAVGQDERGNAAAIGVERADRSGMTRSTPNSSGSGNITPGVDEQGGVAAGDEQHVHAELAESAERNDVHRRRARAPSVVDQRATSHSSGHVRQRRCAARTAAARARRQSARAVRPDWVAGRDPKTGGKTRGTIAQGSARPKRIAPQACNFCDLQRLRSPASVEARRGQHSSAAFGSKRLQGVGQRLPPLLNIALTIRSKRASSESRTPAQPNSSRTTVDRTLGAG